MDRNAFTVARLVRSAKTGCAFLFIALYILTSSRVADLHSFTHDANHTIDHSPAEESNPCHQTLYHAVSKACQHEFHLTQDKFCSLCDAIVYHAHIFEAASDDELITPSRCDIFIHLPSFIGSPGYTSSDRGPPVA